MITSLTLEVTSMSDVCFQTVVRLRVEPQPLFEVGSAPRANRIGAQRSF
jgi:hypothetical protein